MLLGVPRKPNRNNCFVLHIFLECMRLHRCEGCLAACRPERAAASSRRNINRTNQLKRSRASPYTTSIKQESKMAESTPPTPPENNAPPMPWFGMDIGGTLTKLVYFEPRENNRRELDKETEILKNIRRYLTRNSAYGKTGRRDGHLQMDNVTIRGRRGTLHFIRFPTSEVGAFLQLARSKGMAALVNTIYATGGGAYKFEEDFIKEVNMRLSKLDELDALIAGVLFVDAMNPQECYYWAPPQPPHEVDSPPYLEAALSQYVRKPFDFSNPYPFLLVNIGSGVSMLVVNAPNDYYRVSGTRKKKMPSRNEILLVEYGLGAILGLRTCFPPSFGHMCSSQRRAKVSREDLARATLVTITNNIGSIARLCASNERLERVVFCGNFLRVNPLSMKLLSYAMSYWSRGALKALFLEHEGYFGAVGCLLRYDLKNHRKENVSRNDTPERQMDR
nr:pantothenate kinase 3 [Danaus plexippus plexippus]